MNTDKNSRPWLTCLVNHSLAGTAFPSVSIRVHPWFNCFFSTFTPNEAVLKALWIRGDSGGK